MSTRQEVFDLVEACRSELPPDVRLTGKGVTLDYLRDLLRKYTDLTDAEIEGRKPVRTSKRSFIDLFDFAPLEGFKAA